jgi:hypothetical protein
MKTQNDSIREEFQEVLNLKEFKDEIQQKKLNPSFIKNFFEILLEKNNGSDDISIIEAGRSRFESFILNSLKEQNH